MATGKTHAEWCKTGRERITVVLMRTTDADIIEWLENKPSKSGAIKDALRELIHRDTLQGELNPQESPEQGV